MPARLRVSGEGAYDVDLTVTLDRDHDHQAVVTRLEISMAGAAEKDVSRGRGLGPGITAASLRDLSLAALVDYVLTTPPVATALRRISDQSPSSPGEAIDIAELGGTWKTSDRAPSPALARAAKRGAQVVRGRRKPDTEHAAELKAVAKAYKTADAGKKIAAVEALGWGRSTAKAKVRQARESGLIVEPPSRPGRA